jgi:hypothetical protein
MCGFVVALEPWPVLGAVVLAAALYAWRGAGLA